MSARPILLGTDGSPSAAEATLEAIALARELDTRLVVVSVDHAPAAGNAFYGYADVLAKLRQIEHERIEEVLAGVTAAAAEAGVECEPVHAGPDLPIALRICRLAVAWRARLIVVGAHGWSPLRRELHGSVSTAIVHEALCPVLVVPSAEVGEPGLPALDHEVETADHAVG